MMISLLHFRRAFQIWSPALPDFKHIGLAKKFRDNPAGF
jgi:hypothetical protein